MGSFAGGITFALATEHPDLCLTIVDESQAYLQHLQDELSSLVVSQRVRLLDMKLDHLAFPDKSFDLVIMRGAFFFIMTRPNILTEIYRVLKPGALAFVGGGYGRDVPSEIITEIAEESRILNDRLGRRRVSVYELQELLTAIGLDKQAHIVTEGGVWMLLRK